MKIANLCINHKYTPILEDDRFFHIHVGSANSQVELPIHRDDSGHHISEKNPFYSELTGLYWFWKNKSQDYDVVVLNHYRRLFLNDDLAYLSESDVATYLSESDVLLPFKKHYPVSITQQYEIMHYKDDFDVLKSVLDAHYPTYDYKTYWDKSNASFLYNMFGMKREHFDVAMAFVFNVLERVEEKVDISDYSPQQKRIFGFMAERLMSLYCQVHFKNIKELAVEFEDGNGNKVILGHQATGLANKVFFVQKPFSGAVNTVLRRVLKSKSK